jgi:histone arginine demethylase JMJD6
MKTFEPTKLTIMEMYQKFARNKHIEEVDVYLADLSVPFKLNGYIKEWPALKLWDSTFLKKEFGDIVLNASKYTTKKSSSRTFSLKGYLRYMNKTRAANPYYLKDCKFHLGTKMESHYTAPDIFNCWYKTIPVKQRKTTLSWLYIGAKGTFSRLHLDIWNTSAWNAVITGAKLWLFYPPDNQQYLYNGAVNPFFPDLDKFPDFAFARPLIALQRPGDIIYTPSNWWHAVYNLEKGVSLTENFINDSNYANVLAYFQEKSPKSYQSLLELINQNKITAIYE